GLVFLLAYSLAGKATEKTTAPGAIIIEFFGGIHEIYFPYVLMNPILLLAVIGGGMTGVFIETILGAGLVGPASPGSIIAILAMVPKSGGYLAVLAGVAGAALVSFLIATPLLKIFGKDEDIDDAIAQKDAMKSASKGQALTTSATDPADIKRIVFACDAGMGSSAMGATVLQKKLKQAGRDDIRVAHASVSEIPSDAQIVVTHKDLRERAEHSAPQAQLVLITNFMNAPEYDELAQELSHPKAEESAKAAPADEAKTVTGTAGSQSETNRQILQKKNIRLNQKAAPKNDVIRAAGQMLVDSGCVDPIYVDAMLLREESFATNIGNGIAIPHGVEEAKKNVHHSGISIQTFPETTEWEGGPVKLVIGIAGLGDKHLDILARIATKLAKPEEVDRVLQMTPDEIVTFFTED
ncbi:MAG: PTS sugar transporter subunit IIA, partial [Eubacteriaceae bacterium]